MVQVPVKVPVIVFLYTVYIQFLWKKVKYHMPTNEELKDNVIRSYVDLQRIKNAPDKDKEIAYQEQILETRLQQLGVTDLEKLKHIW